MSLNTNQGFNAFAVLVPAIGIVDQMPDGNFKWVLLAIISLVTALVGFKTTGETSSHVEDELESDSIHEIVKKGRK